MFLKRFNSNLNYGQASTDEDGRMRTVHPSMLTIDQNLDSDRQFHGQTRTSDQDYRCKVGEWTDFLPWTAHLIYEFRRTITNIKMWTELDGWTNGRTSVRRGLKLTLIKFKYYVIDRYQRTGNVEVITGIKYR